MKATLTALSVDADAANTPRNGVSKGNKEVSGDLSHTFPTGLAIRLSVLATRTGVGVDDIIRQGVLRMLHEYSCTGKLRFYKGGKVS